MIIRSKKKVQEYWKRFMDSTHRKLSEGAAMISRGMPCAHGDNWRRKEHRKEKAQHGHGKK